MIGSLNYPQMNQSHPLVHLLAAWGVRRSNQTMPGASARYSGPACEPGPASWPVLREGLAGAEKGRAGTLRIGGVGAGARGIAVRIWGLGFGG